MAKICSQCGNRLPFLYGFETCPKCKAAENDKMAKMKAQLSNELDIVSGEILQAKEITEQQVSLLKKQDKQALVDLYDKIFDEFEADDELDESEINTLNKYQNALGLSDEEVMADDGVRPYMYVLAIRKNGELPAISLKVESGSPPVLKKDEVVHYAVNAILNEMKTVDLGFEGGSDGVSFSLPGGVRYRVGAVRGHLVKEDRLVETSRGLLLVTNKRLFLHPSPGNKPASIPLDKILSYQCYGNGIEVYREGNEKGFFFSVVDSGSSEIFGLCLGKLLAR